MKILFYSARQYEIDAFNQVKHNHDLQFIKQSISVDNIDYINQHDAICIFVDDILGYDLLEKLSKTSVKYILLRCAGYNNVDIEAAKKFNIKVARVPRYSNHAVAEHAVALLLALNRKLYKAYNRIRDDNFCLEGLVGFDLKGKTVGVIGAGYIGACFIKIMLAFECNIIVFDPAISNDVKKLPITIASSIDQLLAESDIISLHCPSNEQTKNIINQESINKMKQGVYLINTSRGNLINTQDVIKGLKTKKICGLAIDVYEEEGDLFFEDRSMEIINDDTFQLLLTFPNVLITGHQAFLTKEALHAIAEITLNNASQFEHKGICKNEVQ